MYMNMLKTYEIRYNDKLDTTTFLLGTKCVVVTSPDCMWFVKPVLGSVDSVAPFITVYEQSKSNQDRSFHYSIAFFASEDHITKIFLLDFLHENYLFFYKTKTCGSRPTFPGT